jgi:hypothetical protein
MLSEEDIYNMITKEINGGVEGVLRACSFRKHTVKICELLQEHFQFTLKDFKELSKLNLTEIDWVFKHIPEDYNNANQMWEMHDLCSHCDSPESYRQYRRTQLKYPKSKTNTQYRSRETPRNSISVTAPTTTRNGNTDLHVLLQQMQTIR